MLNVVEFRRPGTPKGGNEPIQTMAIKRDAPLTPFAMPCDCGRGANPQLEATRAQAKLTIERAIATLEQNHRQLRGAVQMITDASARARLETDLNLIERELALAKRKSSTL
ncbi:hypothetical protein [Bradyrhizobium nanningense]|nr:hypothetical protein [Bradyrhizobium nanningense]